MGYPTQQQKVDYLFKKIGFTKTKTGVAEDQTSGFSGDTKKAPPNEAIPSPLVVPSTSLWSDSSLIPTTPPTSNTAYVGIYTAANAYRMTVDSTVANERTFIARQTFGDSSSAIQGDWIDTQFGADYLVKVYMGNPSGISTNLSAAGTSGKDDVWFFDYSSGVLNFNGADLDGQLAGISTDNVYLVGYRYTGGKGAKAPAGIGTFHDLVVHNNFKVGGISTFSGLIDANGLIEATAGQNKIPSLYANYSDLPNAGTYHGMFAHVHATARGYFAHAGGWFELVNKEATGTVGTGTERYNIGPVDATSLKVTGITTLGSIGISTGRIIGPSVTYIDPATVGAAGTVVILGNLQVDGTQTTVNSSVMTVTDKNIELAKGAVNDAAVDNGGITLKSGQGDKTWQWVNATDSWTSSEHIRIPDGRVFGFASDTNTHIGRPAAYTLAFTTDGTERVRIDSNGHVTIGLGANALHNNYLTIPRKSGDASPIRLISLRNDAAPADLDFVKSRSSSYGSYAATQDDDVVMSITSYIDTGSAYSYRGAYKSIFDTANGGVHYTWSSGASIEEKIRFTSDGKVGIGTTNPTSNLQVDGTSITLINKVDTNNTFLTVENTSTGNAGVKIKNASGEFTFIANDRLRIQDEGAGGIERFTILNGNVGINSIAPTARLDVNGTLNVSGVSTFNSNVNVNADVTANSLTLDDDGTGNNILTVKSDDETPYGFVLINDTYKSSAPTGYKLSQSNSGEIEVLLRANTNATRLPYKIRQGNHPSGIWDSFTINADGAVGLAYGGSQKLSTTGYGVNVTGVTTTTQLEIGTLGQTLVGITTILDEDNFASNSATALATQQSIKAYVDTTVTAQDLDIAGDTGTGAVDLDSQSLTIAGTSNEIETSASNQTVTIGLPNDVSITNLTLGGTVSAGSTTGTNGYYLKTTGIGVTWAAFPSSRTGLTTTATAGQTSFNFSYNVGFVDVFVNGVKLPGSEFTASNGSTIVLDDAAFLNDTVEFVSYNTVPNSSAGAQNLNGLADVTITGTPVVGETLQHDGSKFVNDYTITSAKTSTSQTSIHSLAVATYRSVEYTVQITEGTKYHVTKILAIHDGTNATFNEYGTLTTHSSLATFTVDINSGNMRLLATPASSNSTVFKVKFNAIKV